MLNVKTGKCFILSLLRAWSKADFDRPFSLKIEKIVMKLARVWSLVFVSLWPYCEYVRQSCPHRSVSWWCHSAWFLPYPVEVMALSYGPKLLWLLYSLHSFKVCPSVHNLCYLHQWKVLPFFSIVRGLSFSVGSLFQPFDGPLFPPFFVFVIVWFFQ